MGNSPHIVPIHILDDDSLLNIFLLYRPFFLGEGEDELERLYGGDEPWDRGRWWYRLAHLCQRWRNLILGSASYLRLSLVCTNGTPVADMLAHSPPLPLTVDYSGKFGITAEDEEGILLALEKRNRVRHLRLFFPVRNLQKLVTTVDGQFPTLEYLIIEPRVADSTPFMFPETLQAPNLRHLMLRGITCPIRSQLHPTAVGLVTLCLMISHPSSYFEPSVLLQWISFMPYLESLAVAFTFSIPNSDVERQLTHSAPIMTHITLPNLRLFWFRGVITYLEAVIYRVTTPLLERLQIQVLEELTFSIPRLMQYINATKSLSRFDSAEIEFSSERARLETYARETNDYAFAIKVYSGRLDRQVSSVAQISNALSQVFSAVELLTLEHEVHSQSSEEHDDVDRIEWRNLLRSFSKVKTLRIEQGLVERVSRCLRLENGEDPLELLPELQELTYFASCDTDDTFTSFIDARQNSGHPVTLVSHN